MMSKGFDVQESKLSANRAIFKTLKVILDSDTPVTVKSISDATELGERMVQRHAEVLTDVGLVKRLNSRKGRGFVYTSNIKILNQ